MGGEGREVDEEDDDEIKLLILLKFLFDRLFSILLVSLVLLFCFGVVFLAIVEFFVRFEWTSFCLYI